jgi:TetR/AcrR family transcriptional regulator, transcriptional repressor for nem operon
MSQRAKASRSPQLEEAVQRRGPGSKADSSHPTYLQIVDAAIAVADEAGLAEMSINDVTQHAGVAKGTFYVHFSDRAALILALHRKFHDELFARIRSSTLDTTPGALRACARVDAFLDGCRKLPGVRSLLLQARNQTDIHAEVERRNNEAAFITIEVARAELEANKRQAKLRKALHALIHQQSH